MIFEHYFGDGGDEHPLHYGMPGSVGSASRVALVMSSLIPHSCHDAEGVTVGLHLHDALLQGDTTRTVVEGSSGSARRDWDHFAGDERQRPLPSRSPRAPPLEGKISHGVSATSAATNMIRAPSRKHRTIRASVLAHPQRSPKS